MKSVVGSKKSIRLVAAAGTTESKTMRTENTQNMPKSALGNLIEAAAKAFFKSLSDARIMPRDTAKCNILTTYSIEVIMYKTDT